MPALSLVARETRCNHRKSVSRPDWRGGGHEYGRGAESLFERTGERYFGCVVSFCFSSRVFFGEKVSISILGQIPSPIRNLNNRVVAIRQQRVRLHDAVKGELMSTTALLTSDGHFGCHRSPSVAVDNYLCHIAVDVSTERKKSTGWQVAILPVR